MKIPRISDFIYFGSDMQATIVSEKNLNTNSLSQTVIEITNNRSTLHGAVGAEESNLCLETKRNEWGT